MAPSYSLGAFDLMVLLALLRLGDEAYGVTIANEIEAVTGRSISLTTLYATLNRLEGNRLVTSRLGEPTAERGGRAKRFFRPTARGLRATQASKRAFTSLWSGVPALKGDLA